MEEVEAVGKCGRACVFFFISPFLSLFSFPFPLFLLEVLERYRRKIGTCGA